MQLLNSRTRHALPAGLEFELERLLVGPSFSILSAPCRLTCAEHCTHEFWINHKHGTLRRFRFALHRFDEVSPGVRDEQCGIIDDVELEHGRLESAAAGRHILLEQRQRRAACQLALRLQPQRTSCAYHTIV